MNEAKRVLLTLIEIQPSDGDAWRCLANISNLLKQPQDALHACDRALEVAPQAHRDIWLQKAIAYLHLKEYDHALYLLDAILAEDSTNQEVWRQKIFAFRAQKRLVDALQTTEDALAIFPLEKTFWNEKAQILLTLKRFKEAAIAVRQSIVVEDRQRKARG